MPDNNMPPDPFGGEVNTMDEFAALLHELYTACMKAGFTDEQAMAIVLNGQTTIMHLNEHAIEDD